MAKEATDKDIKHLLKVDSRVVSDLVETRECKLKYLQGRVTARSKSIFPADLWKIEDLEVPARGKDHKVARFEMRRLAKILYTEVRLSLTHPIPLFKFTHLFLEQCHYK